MNVENLKELVEYKEAIKKIVKEIIEVFGPDLKEILEGMVDASVDLRIRSIKRFMDAGFKQQEAINMTMDQWYAIKDATRFSKK